MEVSQPSDPARPIPLQDESALNGPEFDRLLGRVHASLDAEQGLAGRLRALPTRVRALLVGTAVALVVGFMLVFARRADFDAYPHWRLVVTAATYAGLLALVSYLVLRPLHWRAASVASERTVVVAGFLAPFCWALTPPPAVAPLVNSASSIVGGRDCLAVGLTLGTALVIGFGALDRAPQANFRSTALFAGGAGLLANLALLCHCPRTRLLHLALVHAPIGLLMLVAYWGVLARLERRFDG